VIQPLQVPLWIDLSAVVIGALAGAGVAARERFELIGALLLAVVMGLGGGIVRDLLLGVRPVAVTSRYYLLSVGLFTIVGVERPCSTAALCFGDLHRCLGRRRRRLVRRPDRRTPCRSDPPRALECHRSPGRRQRVRNCCCS